MSEKVIHSVLLGVFICIGGYLLARGILYLQEDSSKSAHEMMGTLCENMQEEALELYFPQYMMWEDSKRNFNTTEILGEWSVLVQYFRKNSMLETMDEDNLMSQEIIKLHNKLILDEILLENQSAGRQENADENINNFAEEREVPAWAQITEDSVKQNISLEKLKNFNYMLQRFFVVDADTSVNSEIISVTKFMEENFVVKKDDEPRILIYHTHSQEGYIDSVLGDEETTVVGVGNYLEQLMEEVFGYKVIHMKDEFDMMSGTLDRSRAYDYALPAIEQVLEENPTIEVVIDLHRDGVDENRHLVTEINGKPTAQIMLFNGLSRKSNGQQRSSIPNPYIQKNLAFSFQLALEAETYYPDFLRCVYLKGYRYNLHVRPRAILLEVGAQTNTVEEAKNAMEPFSVILNKVINDE